MMFIFYFLILFVGSQPEDDSILWNENEKLEWSDFKGKPDLNSDAAALTASGLSVDLSAKTTKTSLVEYKIVVEARFYPKKSWYKLQFADSFVLAHEQLHFDITELHARILRQRIDGSNFSVNIKKEISILNKRVNKELKEMQKKYDRESNFSRNKETQLKWRSFINNELKKLSKYK